MNWKEKIQLAWQNKGTIMEGFFNAYVASSAEVKKEALARLEICRANTCGMYNPHGKNEGELKAVFPGKESCGGCGCDLYAKTHAMSAHCYLMEHQIKIFRSSLIAGTLDGLFSSHEKVEEATVMTDSQLWDLMNGMKSTGIDLSFLGMAPLWEAALTTEQEIEINKIAYKKQFERRNNPQQ